jgi:hypothetical protein
MRAMSRIGRATVSFCLAGYLLGCGSSSDRPPLVPTPAPTATPAVPRIQACGAGALFNPETCACAPAVSVSASTHRGERPPRLQRLGAQAFSASGEGVFYDANVLAARTSAVLYTRMIVPPGPIATLPGVLYARATNRTDKTLEVMGVFSRNGRDVAVYDWSCSPAEPCGGATEPVWVYYQSVDVGGGCYLSAVDDGAGHVHESLYYLNATDYVDGRWRTMAAFWNRCASRWDVVYQREFDGALADCSVVGATCGYWGPLLHPEFPAGAPVPEIPELGFLHSVLVHDGQVSVFDEIETTFAEGAPDWATCHRTVPNSNAAWTIASECPAMGAIDNGPVCP